MNKLRKHLDGIGSVELERYFETLKLGMACTPCTKPLAVVKNGLYTLYKASRSSEKRFVHTVQSFSQQ